MCAARLFTVHVWFSIAGTSQHSSVTAPACMLTHLFSGVAQPLKSRFCGLIIKAAVSCSCTTRASTLVCTHQH
jgi:hypothetical protein